MFEPIADVIMKAMYLMGYNLETNSCFSFDSINDKQKL